MKIISYVKMFHKGEWRDGSIFRKGRKLYFQPFAPKTGGYWKPIEVKLW
jgi:hypothetical protein